MNKRKTKKRIVTLGAILGAFLLTVSVSPRVFIADSPQVNPNFFAELRKAPADLVAFVRNPFAPGKTDEGVMTAELQVTDAPTGASFTPIAKGVYAAEDPATGQSYVKIEGGTQLEVHNITLEDGRTVTVYVPLE